MPDRQPLRAIPLPAGMDPRQRVAFAVDLAEQALACMDDQPDEAADMLDEARRQLGLAKSGLCGSGEHGEA